MARQKLRPARLGGFSGAKACIRYVEVLKKRRNAVGRTFCDAIIVGNEHGMALMVVLVAVVAVGLAAGATGTTWSTVTQRSREAELIWRGNQYREAIRSYYEIKHGDAPGQYPGSLEHLVKDPRSLTPLRHIRRIYKDPMTGEDFVLIKQGQRIVGVRSSSELEPFKKDGFSQENETFAGAGHYNEWQFMYAPRAAKSKTEVESPLDSPTQ